MKRLVINLLKDDEKVLDEELTYFINEDKINFSHEEELFKILLKDKIFMKKNKESLIKIDFKNKTTTIKLLEENLDFEMKLLKSKYSHKNNEIIMEYVLDDGENVNNYIIIKY